MEIVQILPEIYRFKDCGCSDCTFRFGCWTSQSTCCPLKAVRVMEKWMGDDNLFGCKGIEVSINENLGKFDQALLAKIGEDLVQVYESQQRS